MRKTNLAYAILLLLPATQTIAEEMQSQSITVSATPLLDPRLPNATDIYNDALQILQPATSDTASLLKNIPGVNIQNAGGVSSLPSIHGMADDRLRIKVDGMDLISACGNHMNPPLSYIDPSNVDSAVVFAGISPVSMGGDSIGGTILVDSASPEFAKAGDGVLKKGEVGTSFRSNGNVMSGNISAMAASEQFSLSYQGSTTKADNYKAGDDFKPAGLAAAGRDWLDGDEVGSTMYKSTNHSISMGLKSDNHLIELKLGVQDIPYQGWPNQRMDMTGNDSTQINLSYEGEYDWGQLEARVYNERTRHEMQFYEDKLFWYGSNDPLAIPYYPDGIPCTPSGGPDGCAAGMPMDTKGDNTGLVVKTNIPLSDQDILRLGVELQDYTLDDWWEPSGKGMWPNTFWNINNGERDRRAVFAELETQWNQQWITQLGLRYERVNMDTGEVQGYNNNTTKPYYGTESAAFNAANRKKTDDNIDLTTLAHFIPEDTLTIEFGYAQKTRSPNLYERYAWSTGGMAMRMINMAGDGNGYVGNLNLEPEIAHTLSGTFNWHDAGQEKWELTLSPYYTYVDDYIDAQRCQSLNSNCGGMNQTATNTFVYLQFINQDAHMYGIDISGQYSLADNTQYGDFTAIGLINYVRGENETTNDNLYNMMPLNGKFAVEQANDNWRNILELELVDDKSRVSQVRNEVETAGYGLLHLRSSYSWKQARFDFGIENILDRFYNHPLGGAYVGQGKTMSGSDVAWGTPVPGMGRSLYAGVNIEF